MDLFFRWVTILNSLNITGGVPSTGPILTLDILCNISRALMLFPRILPGYRDSLLQLSSFYSSANILGVFRKEPDNIQWVTFATKNRKLPINTIFLKQRYLLEKFADHFISTWSSQLIQMDKFSVNIKDILGDLFYEEAQSNSYPEVKAKISLLKTLKLMSNHLSLVPKFSSRKWIALIFC